MIARGHAHPSQCKDTAGYIRYRLLGGTYDGVEYRMYPPFVETLVLGPDTYVLSGPKDGRSPKLTYRLKEAK